MGTRLFGLVGWPVGHSVSPVMMNAAFRAIQMDAQYLSFAVPPEHLTAALHGLGALQAAGVNVTIPHKQRAYAIVSDATPEARLAKAVNTVRFASLSSTAGAFTASGHNTDVSGWWRSVRDQLPDGLCEAVVLGAGGAARAVLAALALHRPHLRVYVCARRSSQPEAMKSDFDGRLDVLATDWSQRHKVISGAGLVVNTTPLGMWPNVSASPVEDASCLQSGQIVQDLIYRPLQTQFMMQAQGRGCTVLDGLRMLVAQGADALAWWTGIDPPVRIMEQAARDAVVDQTGV